MSPRADRRVFLIAISVLVAFIFVAGTFAAIRWRAIREAWRFSQVRRQSGYAELREKWRELAPAIVEMRWPPSGHERWRNYGALAKLQAERRVPIPWEGAKGLLSWLEHFTEDVARQAEADFASERMLTEKLLELETEGAFRGLVSMRAAGRLSEASFERAMLVLARDEGCFIRSQEPEAQRVSLRVLCDLVDGEGERVARSPASSLEEALEDAARTRRGEALRLAWRRMLSVRRAAPAGPATLANVGKVLPREVLHEKEAFDILVVLAKATASERPRPPPDAEPAGWPAGLSLAAERKAFEAGVQSGANDLLWHIPDARGRPVAGRLVLSAIMDQEAERLPEELRAPFWAIAAWLVHPSESRHKVHEELMLRGTRGSDLPCPTLRTIAEILRAWG